MADILKYTGVSSWHQKGKKGQGVKALIIDDGWEDRPFFHGKLTIAHTTGPSKSQHGMKTAETFHIAAPETEIHCHEYSYPTPPTPGDVLKYIIDNGIQIVSMSMVGLAFKYYPELMAEASKTALFFTSAGNTGKWLTGMAGSESWISVGAGLLTRNGIETAPYSAPGHDILGLVGIEVHNSKGGLHIPAGTSFACPETAGKAALLAGEMESAYGRKPTPDELKHVVFENLKDGVLILPEEIPERKEREPEMRKDYEGHWAKVSIEKAIQRGAISGYPDGTWKPDKSVTRAELAVILDRLGALD